MLKSFGTLPSPYEFKKPMMFGTRPNMIGTTQAVGYVASDWIGGQNSSGPFYGMKRWQYLFSIGSDGTNGAVIDFNANLANSTYNGNKLQASALQSLPCIRV